MSSTVGGRIGIATHVRSSKLVQEGSDNLISKPALGDPPNANAT